MTDVDAALVSAAQNGDGEAFEALHERLLPALRRFARRLVGDEQDAEDITQDALLSLYVNLSRIDPPQHVRAFAYRIVRNRCYDRLRCAARRKALSLDDDEPLGGVRVSFDLPDLRATPPEEAAHWMLLELEVRQAMETLPELLRQSLLLFADDQLTYREIAEVMGVSIGTVKSRLFHAKRMLHGRLRRGTLAAIREALDADGAPDADDADGVAHLKHALGEETQHERITS